ncbi:MAG: Translation initiation factor 3 subunit J component [Chaenotheca gracillima]|nr:MAG: Translation initiation factor 3 subunit J component [Chaenotheca gracillima]
MATHEFTSHNLSGPSGPNQASTSSRNSRLSTAPSAIKPRQLAHLHAQLAQLQAHMSDLENLVRMTAVQAEFGRGLGGWMGGLFMAASKVLGEETVAAQAQQQQTQTSKSATGDGRNTRRDEEDEEDED